MDDVLGAQAREMDAVAAFGRWQMGLRARVLVVACIAGALIGTAGLWIVTTIQFALWGYAILLLTIGLGGALPFGIAVVSGLAIGRMLVSARTERQLALLAEQYEVDAAALREVKRLLTDL